MKMGICIPAAIAATVVTAMAGQRPNVLFIAIDDLRPELGCYGSPQVRTPNIDRLAAQGMVFTRAYCQVPVCGASGAGLMAGILPTSSRSTSYKTRADKDVPNAATLPEVFKKAGSTKSLVETIDIFPTKIRTRTKRLPADLLAREPCPE